MTAEVLNSLASGSSTDLRPLQIRLAFAGPQSKPLPVVVFTTFHHLLVLNWFTELQSPELSYNEDSLWNFTVTPDEMSRVVKGLAAPGAIPESSEHNAAPFSLALALRQSRLGDVGFEVLMARGDGERLSKTIESALAPTNPLAVGILRQQRVAIFK